MTTRKVSAAIASRFSLLNYSANPVFWDRVLGRRNALPFAERWLAINEFLPFLSLQALRWPRLRRLIEHAYRSATLYRELYRAAEVTPRDLRSERDLPLLPIVRKENIRRWLARNRGTTNVLPRWRHEEGVTSGSTGEPFRFFLDPLYRVERVAMGNRIWRWAGADPYAPKILCAPESAQHYYPNLIFLHPHAARAKKKEYIEAIKTSGARLIFGSPLMAFDFFSALGEGNGGFAFDVEVLGGHAVAPGIRRFFQEHFGCDVFEFYASGEVRMIGIECREHAGLHIQEENVVVEIVDDRGAPLPPGTVGQVVVTSLNNDVMPLIRYALGDRGSFLAGSCRCGRTSRRLVVEGRTQEALLVTPAGESISPAVLRDALDPFFEHFRRYQVVQQSPARLELRIVPTRSYGKEAEGAIVAALKASTGPLVSISVRVVDDIPLTAAGKPRYFVSELWKKKFPRELLEVRPLEERALDSDGSQ